MVDAVLSVVLDQLISPAFEEAIERVRRVTDVKAEVDKLTSNLLAIKAVLSDAEQKQVKEKGIRHWLDQLKEASCDMEDVLDEWITASRRLQIKGIRQKKKVCSFFPVLSCFGFKLRHDIAQKMKEINENLEGISKQKDRFNLHVTRSSEESVRTQSIASLNLPDVRGRVKEKNTLKSKLLVESSEQQNAVQIISLVGMGGIGKTTLAQIVYNDNDVINNFEKRMWVCVSDPFDEYGIAKTIIAALGVSNRDLENVKSLNLHVSLLKLQDVCKQFTCLRALVWHIGGGKIPKAMKNLIHLRFLKLSHLWIEELPETCCELINLETLEIYRCIQLKRLPQGMEKLINLRHLIIRGDVYLEYMPRGIERLTGLRTLSEFVVGAGGKYASKVCKLEGLKGMNHLRGLLKIRMLGDLTNVDEAKHIDLQKKKNLDRLELWFDKVGMADENEENDEAITKVLQLPANLEYLGILHYRGRSLIFPNWIESFNKLKKLLFIDCKKCESLPPLGQLLSLEVLTIWHMQSVERVGDEFLGIENGRLHVISSSSSSSLVTAFPKLKHLTIKGWNKWDEWYFVKENITIMPQLKSLDISLCNNLKSLPDQILQSKTLENLTIEKCPILEERFKKDTGEEWSKISHIPNIRIGQWHV